MLGAGMKSKKKLRAFKKRGVTEKSCWTFLFSILGASFKRGKCFTPPTKSTCSEKGQFHTVHKKLGSPFSKNRSKRCKNLKKKRKICRPKTNCTKKTSKHKKRLLISSKFFRKWPTRKKWQTKAPTEAP